MNSKLGKWLLRWFLVMILLIILIALLFPGKKIDLRDINFRTSASAKIYFKNMRSYFYDIEENDASNYKLYRINSREKDSSKTFNFIIIDNWLIEETYIMLETSLVSFPDSSLQIKYIESDKEQYIQLNEAHNEANYIFAAQLFEPLTKKKQLYLYRLGEWIPFTQDEQKSLKKSLEDYFKLVGKIQ